MLGNLSTSRFSDVLGRVGAPLKKLPPLQLALIAGLVIVVMGGTSAFAIASKNVTLDVDGQTRSVSAFGGTVGDLLAQQDVEVGPQDKINVPVSSPISNNLTVQIRYAKPVIVAVDGDIAERTSFQPTVGGVLDKLDIEHDTDTWISAAPDEPMPRTGGEIIVSNPKKVKVVADGKTKTVETAAPTAYDVLTEAGVKLDADDEVNVGRGTLVSPGEKIVVTRIDVENTVQTITTEPKVEYRDDDSMLKGDTKVLESGEDGITRRRVLLTKANGKDRGALVLSARIVSKPTVRIIARGTKEPEPEPTPAPEPVVAADSAPAPSVGAVPSGSVWDRMAQCESGGNWAINTGNGYYGGLQFSLATWRSVGGPGYPHEQSREVQIHYAEILQARSGWGQWGCSSKIGVY